MDNAHTTNFEQPNEEVAPREASRDTRPVRAFNLNENPLDSSIPIAFLKTTACCLFPMRPPRVVTSDFRTCVVTFLINGQDRLGNQSASKLLTRRLTSLETFPGLGGEEQ
jgi:hypothetical protein